MCFLSFSTVKEYTTGLEESSGGIPSNPGGALGPDSQEDCPPPTPASALELGWVEVPSWELCGLIRDHLKHQAPCGWSGDGEKGTLKGCKPGTTQQELF